MKKEFVFRITIETDTNEIVVSSAEQQAVSVLPESLSVTKEVLSSPVKKKWLEEVIAELVKDQPLTTRKLFAALRKKFSFCDYDKADDGSMIRWEHKTLAAVDHMKRRGAIKKQRGIVEKDTLPFAEF